MAPQAIVFDFDGTIAHSEERHQEAWRRVAAELGLPLPDGFLESGIGRTDQLLVVELESYWGNSLPYMELLQAKRQQFQKIADAAPPVAGAIEAIARLSKKYPLAIATSSCRSDIMPFLNRHQLVGYFQTILTVDDVKHAKPDPEIYLKAARLLNADPRATVAFEDSPTGVCSAVAAGLEVVGILTGFAPAALPGISAAIPNFSDLPWLEQWLAGR